MPVSVLRSADRVPAVWKNGGGVTREIASWPRDAGLDGFDWRISLAEVAAGGPFSAFPGVDRVITVVDGAGMELTVDGVPRLLPERHRPFAFPGDADTDCRLLDGPVTDFNVMTRRDRVRATVRIVGAAPLPAVAAGRAVVLVVLQGRMRFGDILLGRHDAVLTRGTGVTGPASVVCEDGAGVAALVTLDDITGP
ncbi:HutD/Ves family protein [Streptacidiphilus cavernicola]|uniref:HutD family protein n=1 Tax=Streptacidiphilus cavernicola TaxID=3342716 RepID=A0ABV6VSV0_9ACTN